MSAHLNELIARCSNAFIPTQLSDFVGKGSSKEGDGAARVAQHLQHAIALAQQRDNAPLKFLLNGKPGLGKSLLVLYALHLLQCDKFSVTKLNGTQVKIEKVEEIGEQLRFVNIFGDYRAIWVDEADEIPRVAQVRFLTLLDDLPKGTAVFCTSNCKLTDFETRFQTRFQAINVAPPSQPEIASLLARYVDPAQAQQISLFASGNVRAALLDTLGVVQATSQPVLAN